MPKQTHLSTTKPPTQPPTQMTQRTLHRERERESEREREGERAREREKERETESRGRTERARRDIVNLTINMHKFIRREREREKESERKREVESAQEPPPLKARGGSVDTVRLTLMTSHLRAHSPAPLHARMETPLHRSRGLHSPRARARARG